MNPRFLFPIAFILAVSLLIVGCAEKVQRTAKPMFDTKPLDACLVINVDLSSSFSRDFGERAFPLMMKIVGEYFRSQTGNDCKVVLAQTSASSEDETVLFEGSPRQLRQRFADPDALSAFLMSKSDPSRSPIIEAMTTAVGYANAMPDVGDETQMLTVMISDMIESEPDPAKRIAAGRRLSSALKTYQAGGGGLALYYVDVDETPRWTELLDRCGFARGQYVIANELSDVPPMPRMD